MTVLVLCNCTLILQPVEVQVWNYPSLLHLCVHSSRQQICQCSQCEQFCLHLWQEVKFTYIYNWWCDSERNFQDFRVTFHYIWLIHVLACAFVVQLLLFILVLFLVWFLFFHDQGNREECCNNHANLNNPNKALKFILAWPQWKGGITYSPEVVMLRARSATCRHISQSFNKEHVFIIVNSCHRCSCEGASAIMWWMMLYRRWRCGTAGMRYDGAAPHRQARFAALCGMRYVTLHNCLYRTARYDTTPRGTYRRVCSTVTAVKLPPLRWS
jgi:hypothetical protein